MVGDSGLHTGYTGYHCYLAVFSVRYALLATKRFFIIKTETVGIGHGYYSDRHVTATWILVTAPCVLLGYDVLYFSTEMPAFQGKFSSIYRVGVLQGENINPRNLTIFMSKFGLSERKRGAP